MEMGGVDRNKFWGAFAAGREGIRVVRLSGQRVPGDSKLSFIGGQVGLGARVGRVCGL